MGGDPSSSGSCAGTAETDILKPLRILLTPAGSAGDVFPFIGLGRELGRRGHEVAVLTAEPFRRAAEEAGLDFVGVLDEARFDAALDDPDLWNPLRGFHAIFRLMDAGALDRLWDALDSRTVAGRTVLVGHTLSFPTRAFEEATGTPAVTVHLAPVAFRTEHRQPVLPLGLDPDGWPAWLRRLTWWVGDRLVIDPLARRALHPFLRRHGLEPPRRLFRSWIHSPRRVLGFFPPWFGPPQPDWPSQLRLVGFPLYDGSVEPSVDPALAAWIREVGPPVVVTPGSAHRQAPRLFEAAARATADLAVPALFVTPWAQQLPDPLPGHVAHVERAPFRALFPRARAVVHHGGIGTTAQGLAAGVPQVVQGRSFDQPDNGARLERLGVGRALTRGTLGAPALRNALHHLLTDPAVAAATASAKARMEQDAGDAAMARAADEVEAVGRDAFSS